MLYVQMVQSSYIQTPPRIMPLNLRLTRRGITYDTVRTVDQTSKGKANTSPTPPVTMSQSHYITHLLNRGSLKPHTLTLIAKLQSKPLPSSKTMTTCDHSRGEVISPMVTWKLEAREAREIEILSIRGPSRCRCWCLHVITPSRCEDNAAARGKHVAKSAVAT